MKRLNLISVLFLWSLTAITCAKDCPRDLKITHGHIKVSQEALRFKCDSGFTLTPKSLKSIKCVNLQLSSVVLPRCLPTRPPNDDPGIEGEEYQEYDEDKGKKFLKVVNL